MNEEEEALFKLLVGKAFRRKRDKGQYYLSAYRTHHAQIGYAIRLIPVRSGRAHWKTWARFVAEYTHVNGDAIV